MALIWIGAGWLLGLWTAFTLEWPASIYFTLLPIPIAAIVLWRHNPHMRWTGAVLIAASIGGVRAATAQPAFGPNDLATHNDRGVATVVGVIDDYPDRRDTFVNLRVRAETLTFADSPTVPIQGTALVHGDRLGDYRYGDRVAVIGQLQSPPEFATFNYRDYLANTGVYSIIDRPRIEVIAHDQSSPIFAALFAIKDRARRNIATILPEPEASLLTGILLGDESGIPQNVKDDFRRTGTSHIIAISGYNFSLLLGIASVPAIRLFGRRRAVPILLIAVLGYTVLVGASGSVVRAAIMGSLTLVASYLGRQTAALNSLFCAAIVMTALDPFTLGDIGFQLSFAATLGLILYTRPLQNVVERGLTRLFSSGMAKQIVGVLGDAVLVTLAAQITTLPILVVTFRQVSILTLIVNALVLPAQTGVMVFGGLALLAGMVWLPLGQIVGGLAWLFLAWTIQVIHLFAAIPGMTIELGYVDPAWGVVYVALLVAVTFYATRTTEQRAEVRRRMSKIISLRFALPALVIVGLLVALALSWRPDGKLHIHALNVDGMPVLVQTPSGRQILIGGSNSPSALLSALGSRMPFWDRDIDVIVVPEADARSLNGLMAVVDRYHIGAIVSVAIEDTRAGREWQDMIAAKQIEVIEAGAGIGIDDGIALTLNENGWVQIEAGATSVGIGLPPVDAHADVVVMEQAADEARARLVVMQPSIVVTHVSAEPVPGIAFLSTEARAVELVFDGAQWEVRASP